VHGVGAACVVPGDAELAARGSDVARRAAELGREVPQGLVAVPTLVGMNAVNRERERQRERKRGV
jgi:hypothetical protein